MRMLTKGIVSVCLLLSLVFAAAASAAPPAIKQPIPVPDPPKLGDRAYVLMDYNSGRMLVSVNPDEHLPPASLTKMMTAYVVFAELRAGHIGLKDLVPISKKAWQTGGSRMFVEVGKKVPLEDLLQGMIVQSGNDATVALAQYVGGNEQTFVQLMNQYAKALGMTHTHYSDANGLPHDDHYSSAADLAILARALIRDFPQYYHYFSEKEFKWNGINQPNRNRLLWRDSAVDGLKTGHTEAAGYCLVASAKQNGMRLISVVMGAPTDEARARDSQALLNYGFRFFETHRLYQANQALTTTRVWKAAKDTVPLGIKKDLYVTIPRHQYDKLKASMTVNRVIMAPITKGQRLGSIVVKLNDKEIASAPLVSLTAVKQGNLWQRAMDDVILMFH